MSHCLDRYIPLNINLEAISENKGVKIDHSIDLFNNDIKLKDDTNTIGFEKKIMAMDKDTLIDQIISTHKQKVDSYHQFIQTNLKSHGQKNWINLKKNFVSQAFLTDAMSVLKAEKSLNLMIQSNPKSKN